MGAVSYYRKKTAKVCSALIVHAEEYICMTRQRKNTGERFSMKSNNTSIVFSRVIIFLLVTLLCIGGVIAWWVDGTQSTDPTDHTPIVFTVNAGDGARVIATNLAQQHLIRSPTAFFLLVKYMGIEKKLQAGDFRLNRAMDSRTVAEQLTHGFEDVWVTTLEGWRDEEIAAVLSKNLDIPESEFLKVAREGYMFPDTYRIPRDATSGAIVNMFRSTFDDKITPSMKTSAAKRGLTMDQVVTMASLVEREGVSDEDRPVIAGILLKRLKADWPLQVDATLQYALGYQANEKTWWKKELTDADRSVKSPYNTYINTGLPPGPICNPGLSSVTAVISPKETDFWYYIHDPKGGVHYAKTIEEHNANISKYLQ